MCARKACTQTPLVTSIAETELERTPAVIRCRDHACANFVDAFKKSLQRSLQTSLFKRTHRPHHDTIPPYDGPTCRPSVADSIRVAGSLAVSEGATVSCGPFRTELCDARATSLFVVARGRTMKRRELCACFVPWTSLTLRSGSILCISILTVNSIFDLTVDAELEDEPPSTLS